MPILQAFLCLVKRTQTTVVGLLVVHKQALAFK